MFYKNNSHKCYPSISNLVLQVKETINRRGLLNFQDIAYQYLSQLSDISAFSLPNILEWASQAEIPQQSHFFGEKSVTLYYDENFVVDLYYWTTTDTDIHDHGFCGAFCVLNGEILQNTYRFVLADTVKDTYFGTLKPIKSELLSKPHQIQKIYTGTEFIHKTVHIAPLTVTLCIRTTMGRSSQFGYYEMGIATPMVRSPNEQLLLSLLAYIEQLSLSELLPVIVLLLKDGHFATAVDLMISFASALPNISISTLFELTDFPNCCQKYLISQIEFNKQLLAYESQLSKYCREAKLKLERFKLSLIGFTSTVAEI